MFKTKKKFLVAFLSLIIGAQYSCKEDTTEPTDSVTTTEEMYTIGAKSVTADIIKTSDGGYLMVGTSYASTNVEGDIAAIKTDSRGIQQWSTSMGKVPGTGTGSLAGQTIKYDEMGVKVVEEADGSYTIAGNRTYVAYPNASSTSGVRKHTKIVFYKLSASGTATTSDGVELRSSTEFTDQVSDFKIDASSGASQYILTGYTSDIQQNKPNDANNGAYDFTDILTMSLDASFNALWSNSSSAYGFAGSDYGTSVQVMSNGYLIIGTTEESVSSSSTAYFSRFTTVLFTKSGGTPINVSLFGDQDYELEGGYSVYDATNNRITIVGNTTGSSNIAAGQLVVFQIDDNLSIQNPNASNTNGFGFELITPTAPTATSINNTFKANSIALIPNNGGFAISSTLSDNLGKDICISKLANDFSLPATSWPHYYGTGSSVSTSQEWAGPVIPILDTNGAVEYAYTGTFNANTSTSQIGWVLF
jgi:hypothetical protein